MHTHTVHSDGTTTVEQNVRDAVALDLEGLAVTDHDTTSPFDEAHAAADGASVTVSRIVGDDPVPPGHDPSVPRRRDQRSA